MPSDSDRGAPLLDRDQARHQVRDLILEGVASEDAGPMDDAYFGRLRARARE
jgi:hypothetical protein